jgi:hypothetical protein
MDWRVGTVPTLYYTKGEAPSARSYAKKIGAKQYYVDSKHKKK